MKNPSRNSLSKDFVIFLLNIYLVKILVQWNKNTGRHLDASFLYYRMINSFGNFVNTSTPSFVTTTSSSIRTPVTSDL